MYMFLKNAQDHLLSVTHSQVDLEESHLLNFRRLFKTLPALSSKHYSYF